MHGAPAHLLNLSGVSAAEFCADDRYSLFIHSFVRSDHFYSAYSSPFVLRSAPDTAWILCRSLHAEALRTTASEGLAQGPYVASRAGVEPTTLRFKAIDSTNAPPRPTLSR